MNDDKDDETEPMTRLLGVVVREPREGEPQKRLADLQDRKPAELTRLEISRPKTLSTYRSAEPPTQIVTPDLMRPMLSLGNATQPGQARRPAQDVPTPTPPQPFRGDRESPAMPIKPVFAPRLSQADKQEITASRKTPQRAMPILLGIALVMFVATGASLFRERARAAKRASIAAAQVEAMRTAPPAQPSATAAPATTVQAAPRATTPLPVAAPAAVVAPEPAATPSPAAAPEAPRPTAAAAAPAPAPNTPNTPIAPAEVPAGPLEGFGLADLEKRAVDRLRDNDHVAALALYTELARAQPKNPAFPVMVSLLTRRVRACQGDPSCAQ